MKSDLTSLIISCPAPRARAGHEKNRMCGAALTRGAFAVQSEPSTPDILRMGKVIVVRTVPQNSVVAVIGGTTVLGIFLVVVTVASTATGISVVAVVGATTVLGISLVAVIVASTLTGISIVAVVGATTVLGVSVERSGSHSC